MPPKKDPAAEGEAADLIKGFSQRDSKLLAAAFISSIGPDKVSTLRARPDIHLSIASTTMS